MISLEDVRVSYGPAVALDGVTERAADGEWLCLIGPNGAGKTTLLQAVARQVRHGGRIEVCGQPTGGMSRRKLARLVAYVPQRPQLPPDMTVGDYVLLGRTPHIGYLRVETDADRRISAELIDRLARSALAGRQLRTLSGGELQRLVLARALAQQAPVLLLDEPTSALDLGRRVDALELVADLNVAAVADLAGHRPQQGGLPGAVRADQAEPLAVCGSLGDPVERDRRAVADPDVLEADHDRSRRVRRDRSTNRKNGAPIVAVITVSGTSAGAWTVRATTSARTRNAAPPIIETGSTIR